MKYIDLWILFFVEIGSFLLKRVLILALFIGFCSGKREPENDLETKVNLKKQKKDVIAAVQKEKAEKKVPKKVESSDSSDSSDSEEEEKV